MTGTINGSLAAAFDAFRRGLVTEFLAWQRTIVDDYRRESQFVTQNFDYEWRGHSFGVQGTVDHFKAADAVTLAGVDIYHPGEDRLTGHEIGFGGDISRSLKDGAPYLVVETQAQGQMGWLPYPGQLRLQAYSHLASGAMGVMYWHWGSLHNSFETYWKGLLSQDYSPNPTYLEAAGFGREIAEHAEALTGLTKRNRIAMMVSNDSLTALEWFGLESGFPRRYSGGGANYNDVFRWVYDALFDLNLEADVVPADAAACEGGSDVEVLAVYDHHAWSGPAIATRAVGRGSLTHLAAMTSPALTRALLRLVARRAGATDWAADLAGTVTVRKGVNGAGRPLTYLLNYSRDAVRVTLPVGGRDVLGTARPAGGALAAGADVVVPAWGVLIVEGERD